MVLYFNTTLVISTESLTGFKVSPNVATWLAK